MVLTNEINLLKCKIVEFIGPFGEYVAAKLFDFPNNPGMPIRKAATFDYMTKLHTIVGRLPKIGTAFPPRALPRTMGQVFFGNVPHMPKIERVIFESKSDGFYNFYIQNYKDLLFLPNWASQWIQIHFNITIDILPLLSIQEGLFICSTVYFLMVDFRMNLFWFLTVNPYTRPWVYFIAITDWAYDIVAGLIPVAFGLDIAGTVLLSCIGLVGDVMNHLVFTMPFLPTEGQPGRIKIGKHVKDIIMYKNLPYLWYSHPIPNELREFWYTERPDILRYMEKSYGHLNIDFLPERILKEVYEQQTLLNHTDNASILISNVIYGNIVNFGHNFKDLFEYKINLLMSNIDQFIN